MNKRLSFLRFLFVLVMLCCVGILIWLVPAGRAVSNAIVKARDDIDWYNQLIVKQEQVDHVKLLDGILEKQEYLDEHMTPEFDDYWKAYQIKQTAMQNYTVVNAEKAELEDDVRFYEEELDRLLHPEDYEESEEEDEEYEEDDTY